MFSRLVTVESGLQGIIVPNSQGQFSPDKKAIQFSRIEDPEHEDFCERTDDKWNDKSNGTGCVGVGSQGYQEIGICKK